MALTILDTPGAGNRWLAAAAVLARAGSELVAASVRHPGKPLAISRATGRVTLR